MNSRSQQTFSIELTQALKRKLLAWAQQFEEVLWLDSNNHKDPYGQCEAILATDALTAIKTDYKGAFNDLSEFYSTNQDWIFGFLTYDLKNDVEQLSSKNHDGLEFPDLYFFRPKRLIFVYPDKLVFSYLPMVEDELEEDWKAVQEQKVSYLNASIEPVKVQLRTTKDQYFKTFETIQKHISRGNIFETNYCQEFYAKEAQINPLGAFWSLNEISQTPFATFGKWDSLYLASASPERYLRKKGNRIWSQPIKGTAKRGATPQEDAQIVKKLLEDPKERSENIMITDLVRNDLSKIAVKGTVKVSELCGIYHFEQVHQLITTVTAEVPPEADPIQLIKATFPMGSMTGAPKVSAMKIAEATEDFKRGLYSGTVGYISPSGDFDFNVIIRSILYNQEQQYASFAVGGAITAAANPTDEYEECLLKAKAMREVLTDKS